MLNKIFGILLFTLFTSLSSFGQASRAKDHRDSAIFARLIMATKEFKREKQKMDSVYIATGKMAIAAFEIQMDEPADKEDKPARKSKADKDDADDKEDKPAKTEKTATPADPEDNFLTATIIEQQGAANIIVYELKYDRKKHQIISIKPFSDGLDISVDSE